MADLNSKMNVISISRYTIHNGPGNRTLILFKGCPLRCKWCSTPESQENKQILSCNKISKKCIQCGSCVKVCPEQAISLQEDGPVIDREKCSNCFECTKVCHAKTLTVSGTYMTVRQIIKEVMKSKALFDTSNGGVTLSGGEFTYEEFDEKMVLVKELHRLGISIGIDTCGFAYPKRYEDLKPYVDFYLWDIKQVNPIIHKEITEKENQKIFNNLMRVNEHGIDIYLRCPIIPGMTDNYSNIHGICEIAKKIKCLKSVDIFPVHHLGKARYDMIGMEYPIDPELKLSKERQEEIVNIIKSYDLPVKVIG